MIRRLPILLLALLALPLVSTAQDAPPRSVEVRVVALSRGYMRPMRATAKRIAALEGIDKVEMLGFEGDSARYRLSTKLDNKGIAAALQLKILGEGSSSLTLAADDSPRARHAEARGVLMQIAMKISAEPRPTWRGTGERLFTEKDSTKQKMVRLGLAPEIMSGSTYGIDDYHIDETWQGSSSEYRIWVGDKYEGVSIPNQNDPWGDSSESEPEAEPDGESNFVGIQMYRTQWQESINWVDVEGLQLNGYDGERSDTDPDGELYVQQGADWLKTLLQAVTAYRMQYPKNKVSDLPHGSGWGILNELENRDEDLNRWDQDHYTIADFRMRWRDEDGKYIVNLRAHFPAHPFYLEAEVDTTAVLKAYDERKKDDPELDLRKVNRAELGDALTWICAAEESVEVFNKRRDEAREGTQKIRDALQKAAGKYSIAELCGRLDDATLAGRLGVTLPEDGEFKPGDYTIRPQMLGDIELSVGTVRSGGRWWQLVNVASGKVIRSNQ
ncbi:MAG: hypothetical protein KDB82_17320 [Planctomycetes bacterium]|nr:hypothetical protein [Planctomycetota bacterium]